MKKIISLLLIMMICLTGCTARNIPMLSVSGGALPIVKPVPRGGQDGGQGGGSGAPGTVAPASDLSNVINADDYDYMPDDWRELILKNQFVVYGGAGSEFFEIYEYNRYGQVPNFITTDSMMHTYHLYFSYLLRKTEKEYLIGALQELGEEMLEQSVKQAAVLEGSEWEEAAALNEAFFAVGVKLLDPDWDPGQELPEELAAVVDSETELVYAAQDIEISPLFGDYEDYSQYLPRGYYEGDPDLERYFRAMMWYGRRNFAQNEELTDRCALLITLAVAEGPSDLWESVYDITSFFAGRSDDSGYQEYLPLIEEAYGIRPETEELIGDKAAFSQYHRLTRRVEPPAVNSVPMEDDGGKTDKTRQARGFRFMGQRFSLDAAIFQKLCYSVVKENKDGVRRMLPNGLDIPAAMGSEEALEIIRDIGAADYPNYEKQMERVRRMIAEAEDTTWKASLYAEWLYTLLPLLTEKGEEYPAFMQNQAWTRKSLEGFMGSVTELKHDTVLYSKQFMAEMGGGYEEDIDDRGYVEPEPEVFRRLSALTEKTKDSLAGAGMIGEAEEESLERLQMLADSLAVIAEKELKGELPTDDEFELILTYGGQLEHFWEDAVKDQAGEAEYLDSRLFPAAVVVDTATDPNGSVLEFGTGTPSTVYVIVPVDGILRIAVGSVYTYYEFEQPISERLTDSKWRQMLGVEIVSEEQMYSGREDVPQPSWTTTYRAYYPW